MSGITNNSRDLINLGALEEQSGINIEAQEGTLGDAQVRVWTMPELITEIFSFKPSGACDCFKSMQAMAFYSE